MLFSGFSSPQTTAHTIGNFYSYNNVLHHKALVPASGVHGPRNHFSPFYGMSWAKQPTEWARANGYKGHREIKIFKFKILPNVCI